MNRYLGMAWVVLAATPVGAQPASTAKTPESLLSAESLAYFRYDGYEPHRQSYDKTALARIMKDDLGEFLDYFSLYLRDNLIKALMPEEDRKAAGGVLGLHKRLGMLSGGKLPAAGPFALLDHFKPPASGFSRALGNRAIKNDMGLDLRLAFLGRSMIFLQPPIKPGISPEAKKTIQQLDRFMEYFWRYGIVVGLEWENFANLGQGLHRRLGNRFGLGGDPNRAIDRGQITLIFPEGGVPKNRDAVFAILKMIKKDPRERKVGHRTIYEFKDDDYRGAWWQEGKHVIFAWGDAPFESTLEVIEGRRPNVTTSPLFQKLAGFNSYQTDSRGFVDLEKIVTMLRTPTENNNLFERIAEGMVRHVILSQLGLTGVKNLSFHLGFEGEYLRSTVVLNVDEPEARTGLLRLVSTPLKFEAKDLPPMPPDAAWISVQHVDWQTVYQVLHQGFKFIELGMGSEIPWPDLGIDLQKDLLGSLEPILVDYNALSEGPFVLGQVAAIKVKDEKKLKKALDALERSLARILDEDKEPKKDVPRFAPPAPVELKVPEKDPPQKEAPPKEPPPKKDPLLKGQGVAFLQAQPKGGDLPLFQKKTYRGVDMYVLTPPNVQRGDPVSVFAQILPITYTIHKGWLVVSTYPQPVKGYILRCEGRHKTWQFPPITQKAIAQALKAGGPKTKLGAVIVDDPRPILETGLAMLPLLTQTLNASGIGRGRSGLEPFDVSKIPNAQAVTEFLFPSVTVFCDDGTALRWENHYSIDTDVLLLGVLPFWVGMFGFLF